MIVTGDEMRAMEEAAFASGATANDLMEQAGAQIAQAVRQFYPAPATVLVFYGKGHNGGDALVAARRLAEVGWRIVLRAQENDPAKLSELTRIKLDALGPQKKQTQRPRVILDGLLGIGARGPLRDDIRVLTREINRYRCKHGAHTFAIDLPTGLDSETGEADADCVLADFTLTIGFAKHGLVADRAANFVGRLAVLPLEQLVGKTKTDDEVATPANLAPLLPRRKFESHKTNYGRIGIVAGSVGFTGAALLAAEGALRAGAGLVTLYALPEIQPILASTAPKEVMVKPIASYLEVPDSKRDVLAIGPGLGSERSDEILQLIERSDCPMIVDADALNALAKTKNIPLLTRCAGPRLLTPHPGEMARLFETENRSRSEIVHVFTERFSVTLLLKGSRTVIGEKGKPLSYNTTGSPGMATGGMGDVLTGVCAALTGQKLALFDAARLGAWLCGRAAELAIFHGPESEESLAATDITRHLGTAFKQLQAGCF